MDKSAKKIVSRTTAVAMTLSLSCTPALAASFDDVQNAVNGETSAGVRIEDSEREDHYGYGDQNADTGFYGVESWNDPNVTGGSYIQLNEDVSKEDGTLEGIQVGAGDGNVSLDLNGYDMVSDHYDPEKGTGPFNTPTEGESYGSVVEVGKDASLTIKDSSSENTEEQGSISGGFGVYDGGGGVLVDGGTLNVEGGNISDNASFGTGGGIGVKNGGTVNITGGSVHDNVNSGIHMSDSTLYMSDGTVSDNNSYGIHASSGSQITLDGGQIAGNTGSGIYLEQGSSLTMNDGLIENNRSANGGGVLLNDYGTWKKSEMIMNGGTIRSNEASVSGGGIYAAGKNELTLNEGLIEGNIAGDSGGGIAATTLTMNGGNILNNTVTQFSGGGVNVDTMTMAGGTIRGNKAKGSGGGIAATKLTMNKGLIEGNESEGAGGGIFTQFFTMNSGTINKNISQGFGGGVDAVDTMTMAGGTISNNSVKAANNGGGGLSSYHFYMSDGLIEGNSADYGGGAAVGTDMKITGGTIRNNTATGSEGGGLVLNGTGTIEAAEGKNIYITGNRTLTKDDLGGGGLYVSLRGHLEMMNVIVTGNKAGMMGGGMAACHTGRNFVYAADGGAIFDNTSGGAGLDEYNIVNGDADGGSYWRNWTPAQRRLFLAASQDIFTAGLKGYNGFDAGAIIGNVMLGSPEYGDKLADLTPAQLQDVAKHLYNWLGYQVSASDSATLHPVDAGNNGTIYSDHFLSLTAHPLEEGKTAAMEKGRIFITGNEAVYNHGGGIANDGTLVIGKESDSISTMPDVLLETTWLDQNDQKKTLKGDDFSFELKGGKIADAGGQDLKDKKIKTLVTGNDPDGNGMFEMFGNDFLTEPGTYQFTLREHCPEEQEKDGLQYDRSEYRITFHTSVEKKEGTIGLEPYKANTLILHDFKVEQIKDAQGRVLETPKQLDVKLGGRLPFVNTTVVETPDQPEGPDQPRTPDQPEEPFVPEKKPAEQKGDQRKPTAAVHIKTAAQKTSEKTTIVSSTKKSPDTGISMHTKLHENLFSFLGLGALGAWFAGKRKH